MIPNLHHFGHIRVGFFRSFACGVAVLLATPAAWASAQDAKPAYPSAEAPKEAASGQSWELDIAGGNLLRHDGKKVPATLGVVIGYLRDLYPANVVLAPGVGEIKVMDLKLASFKWETALEALRVASGDAFVWNRRPENPGAPSIDPTTGVPVPVVSSSSDDLLVLTPNEAGPASRSRRVVEVFNLSGYLHGQNPAKVNENLDKIMQAVSETLSLLHEGSPAESAGPRFKYHQSSALFIVIGSPEEVEVARKIVLALPDTTGSKDPAWQPGMDDAFRRRYGLPPASVPTAPNPPPDGRVTH
jgi:hypothetical protein